MHIIIHWEAQIWPVKRALFSRFSPPLPFVFVLIIAKEDGQPASTLFSSLIRWRGDGLSRLVAFTHCVCGFEPTVLICLERPRPARFLIIKNSLCGLLWRWLCCQKRPRTWWALVHTSDLFNSSTYLFNDVIDHNEVWSAAVSFNDDNVFSLHVPFYCDTIVVILHCGFRP